MSGPDAEALYELPEEMRIVAGMLTMGERIQFGRDAALLSKGAAEIERLRARVERPAATILPRCITKDGDAPCDGFEDMHRRYHALLGEMIELRDKLEFALQWAEGLPRSAYDPCMHLASEDDVLAFKNTLRSA